MRWSKLVALVTFAFLALIAASCSSDDGGSTDTTDAADGATDDVDVTTTTPSRDLDCPDTTATTAATSTTIAPICLLLDHVTEDELDQASEIWSGTIHTDGNLGGCLDSWDGPFVLQIEGEKITGAGIVATTGQPGCTVLGGAAGAPYSENFAVEGSVSGDSYRLEFVDPTDTCLSLAGGGASIACWGVAGGTIERTDSSLGGSFTTDLGQTTFETTIELTQL